MHTVYIIDDDENLKNKLNEEFKKDENYKFKQIRTEEHFIPHYCSALSNISRKNRHNGLVATKRSK